MQRCVTCVYCIFQKLTAGPKLPYFATVQFVHRPHCRHVITVKNHVQLTKSIHGLEYHGI